MLNLKPDIPDLSVQGYCVDSRNIQPGQLFFAGAFMLAKIFHDWALWSILS